MGARKKQSFEAIVDELEGLVETLESNEVPLEEAVSAYERGMKLAAEGQARLAAVEQRIREVTEHTEIDRPDAEILGTTDDDAAD